MGGSNLWRHFLFMLLMIYSLNRGISNTSQENENCKMNITNFTKLKEKLEKSKSCMSEIMNEKDSWAKYNEMCRDPIMVLFNIKSTI